ncbi:MAG: hypothetical protein IJI07_04375 [Flexilinea sp.]|nr:hypothetical protein [Flexilinea sp.]
MYQDPGKRMKQLRYLADFPSGGDLVIISPVYEDGTVAAYEELIGSHGGLGGQQTDPFLMYSSAIRAGEEIINANQVFGVLKKIKKSPVPRNGNTDKGAGAEKPSLRGLWRQIKDTRHWVPVLIRSLYFSPDAFKTAANDASFNGPAFLIGLISFLCTWIAVNSYFRFRYSPLTNFGMVILNYGIALLAGYLSIVVMRGKKDFGKLVRAFLFTSYWEILWLFALTHQAATAWIVIVLLLTVNILVSSAYAAGDLKKKQLVPLFLVILVLLPALTVGWLMLYRFFTFPRGV